MKIQRFQDKDSRGALSQVRAQMGADAVILSNKNVSGRVEIVAAMDFDEAELESAENIPSVDSGPTLDELKREVNHLRAIVEAKGSGAARADSGKKRSAKALLHSRLIRMGLSRALCSVIVNKMPTDGNVQSYWDKALAMLASTISVPQSDSLIDKGGIVALMGSTGVGKTTTVAKLAARFVLRYGCEKVALITTDCYRIGGQEQLHTFADYLGIPMVVATDGEQLKTALDELSPRKLILIDTAGMSQRDMRLYEQFATLNSVGYDIDTYVVLSATAQQRALAEVVNVFGSDALAGAMITKVDESVGMGGVLDVVIKNRLPVAYVSQGQQVPQDIAPAQVDQIIGTAVKLMDQGSDRGPQTAGHANTANTSAVQH